MDLGMMNPVNLIILSTCLGLLPFMLTILTSYCKIVVVTYLVRNAMGVQQVPPTMVMSALAMILSAFVMAPVGHATYELLKDNQVPQSFTVESISETIDIVGQPLHDFLEANSDPRITHAFINTATRLWPEELHDSIDEHSYIFVVPSFVITELTKAFQIGFLLYLPFIAIDLIISNILLAMGMMMVSPMTISLPFKLMLFVTLDGWLKLSQGLLYSYVY